MHSQTNIVIIGTGNVATYIAQGFLGSATLKLVQAFNHKKSSKRQRKERNLKWKWNV